MSARMPTEATRSRGSVCYTPPRNELPRSVPIRVPLASTTDLAVWLDGVLVWTTGFEFTLTFARKHPAATYGWRPPFVRFGSDVTSSLATLSVTFSDGRTNISSAKAALADDGKPIGPVTTYRPGADGLRRTEEKMYVWPLPPPGLVTLELSWPAGGIPVTEGHIDGAVLRAAADEVEQLWPENMDSPPAAKPQPPV
jgi:hypothetical protein